jgi:hypothetical protein
MAAVVVLASPAAMSAPVVLAVASEALNAETKRLTADLASAAVVAPVRAPIARAASCVSETADFNLPRLDNCVPVASRCD